MKFQVLMLHIICPAVKPCCTDITCELLYISCKVRIPVHSHEFEFDKTLIYSVADMKSIFLKCIEETLSQFG